MHERHDRHDDAHRRVPLFQIAARDPDEAAPPTTASICDAGPVRVCQNSRSVAARQGSAAPMTRRRSSRSLRRTMTSTPQPITPVTGSAMINVAMRHRACRTGRASLTWLSHRRSTSGDTPSSRCRHAARSSVEAAMMTPAPNATPSRRFQPRRRYPGEGEHQRAAEQRHRRARPGTMRRKPRPNCHSNRRRGSKAPSSRRAPRRTRAAAHFLRHRRPRTAPSPHRRLRDR